MMELATEKVETFKVVYQHCVLDLFNDRMILRSALIDDPDMAICYEPEKWIKPKVGLIFAFQKESMARSWMSCQGLSGRGGRLWRAEAMEAYNVPKWMRAGIVNRGYQQEIKEFWKELFAMDENAKTFPGARPRLSLGCIIGTVFCTSIKLVEDIT